MPDGRSTLFDLPSSRAHMDALCTIGGCGKPLKSCGYCAMHYARWRKHGDPSVVLPRGTHPRTSRFIAKDERFGQWIVLEHTRPPEGRDGQWYLARCECGAERSVRACDLLSGRSQGCKSCGSRKHGMALSDAYRTHRSMIQRCSDSARREFAQYGGRGIRVCDAWHSFEAWWQDIRALHGCPYDDRGRRVSNRTLDRIDVNGNYEPGNVRWATPSEQNANKQHHARIAELEAENARLRALLRTHGIEAN